MGIERSVPPVSVEDFLSWAEAQDGRHELDDGRIVAMAAERTLHLEVKGNVYDALRRAAASCGRPCHVLPDGASIRIGARSVYEPDALVYEGERLPGDTIEIPAPVIVVEVLSPSTAMRDATTKLAGYFTVPSIAHYVIVDPEGGLVVHHARTGEGPITTRIAGQGTIDLMPPGLTLDIGHLLPVRRGS